MKITYRGIFISVCLLCLFVTSIILYNHRLLLRQYEDLELRLADNLATLNTVENDSLELQDALLSTSFQLDSSLEDVMILENQLKSCEKVIGMIHPEEKISIYLETIWTAKKGLTDRDEQFKSMDKTLNSVSPLLTNSLYKNHSATNSLTALYNAANELGQDLVPSDIQIHLSSNRDNHLFYDYTLYFEHIIDPDTQESFSLNGSVMLSQENDQWLIDHDTFITTTMNQLGAFLHRR